MSDLYERLCYFDKRNPNGYHSIDPDDDTTAPREKGCACDNCFYGRDALALEAIRYREALERVIPVFDEAMSHLSLAKHDLYKAGVGGYLDKINACQEEGEDALTHALAALRPE